MSESTRRYATILLGCAALVAALPAAAEEDAVAKARSTVSELGKRWNGEVNAGTRAAYVELQRAADRSGVRVMMDVSYGPHELQVMDVFVPEEPPADPMPVVAYFHGGGLTGGDKVGADGLIYSNIPTFFARHGVEEVNFTFEGHNDARQRGIRSSVSLSRPTAIWPISSDAPATKMSTL